MDDPYKGKLRTYARVECGWPTCEVLDEASIDMPGSRGKTGAIRYRFKPEGWRHSIGLGWLCPEHAQAKYKRA